MFDRGDKVITKIFNPLKVTKSSMIEFSIGFLANTGLYRFKKIIEMGMGGRLYTRYVVYSPVEDEEYVFEVFPLNNDKFECYLYRLSDTVTFSEEFLYEVAGQKYLTTPAGDEYERCEEQHSDERIDGKFGRVKVYDIETDRIEREYRIQTWDYQREVDGLTEYLNVEIPDDTHIIRIFTGELIEDIFFKFYQSSKM